MRIGRGWFLAGLLAISPACSGDKDEPAEVTAPEAGAEKVDEPAAEPVEPPPAVEAPPAPPPPASAAAPAAEPEGFTGPKVSRYVRVVAVKVHPLPNKEAPTIGWIHHGAKVDVVINGDWAKLDSGKYISNKFLVEEAPSADAPAKKKSKK